MAAFVLLVSLPLADPALVSTSLDGRFAYSPEEAFSTVASSGQMICKQEGEGGGEMSQASSDRTLSIVRWMARIAAVLAAGTILLFFVGEGLSEGIGPLLQMTLRESLMMAAFAVLWLGLVVGWLWELVGGLLTIGGAIAFYALDYAFSGTFPRGPYFLVLASPGLLFLATAWLSRKGMEARHP